MKKPSPKTVKQVCTLCGLDWGLHGEAPTTDKCVELLLSEVRSLNAALAHRPTVVNPFYTPRYRTYWPNVTWTSTSTGNQSAGTTLQLTQGAMPSPRNVVQ